MVRLTGRLGSLPLLLAIAAGGCAQEPGALYTVLGTGVAGLGDEGEAPHETRLYMPMDVVLDGGERFVVDWNNNRIRRWTDDVVTTVIGSGVSGDGPYGVPATESRLNHCTDVALAPDGRWLLADWHNHRLKWVELGGDIEIAYGTGELGYSGDGGPAEDAQLNYPVSVQFDSAGRLVVADQGNNRVRRIDGGVIETIVGTGLGTGFDEDGAALDRCIGASPEGVIPCFTGDGGPATEATLNNTLGQSGVPMGRVELDEDDGLWIADTKSHVVRFVDPGTGLIDTVAGVGGEIGADDGDALAATFNAPHDLALAPDGAVYIADTDNHCIRVLRDEVLETAAGVCGTPGYDGDGGAPTDALLRNPYGVAVDDEGIVYIADTFNHVVRAFRP